MYLGIDVGTTALKLVLIDASQDLIDAESVRLSVSRPKPLWSEQDPISWWQALNAAIGILQQRRPQEFKEIIAIGLSGQMHGATLLDKKNNILRPAILWNDGRSFDECQQLMSQTDATTITGNLVMPGFTAPKLLWLKKHEPEIFSKIDKVLLPKDYIRWCLSGDYATDMSDASGTSWLNVAKRQWSNEMLAACDLTTKQMPELFEGNQVTSVLKKELAQKWGMQNQVKIIAGAGDNAASAISIDAVNNGDAFLSLGTSGVYFVAINQYHANPEKAVHSYCHCLPNQWHQMSVHLSAASCLEWGTNLLKFDSVADFINCAQNKQITKTLFLPYLSGERSPHNNPHARGVFFGLDHDSNDADLAQAILEGVAFAFADGQTAMQDSGVTIKQVAVVGGGARSHYWGEILASALNRDLHYGDNREVGAAFGAAKLAWIAINGMQKNRNPTSTVIQPSPQRCDDYQHKQYFFKQLYKNLEPTFLNYMQQGE